MRYWLVNTNGSLSRGETVKLVTLEEVYWLRKGGSDNSFEESRGNVTDGFFPTFFNLIRWDVSISVWGTEDALRRTEAGMYQKEWGVWKRTLLNLSALGKERLVLAILNNPVSPWPLLGDKNEEREWTGPSQIRVRYCSRQVSDYLRNLYTSYKGDSCFFNRYGNWDPVRVRNSFKVTQAGGDSHRERKKGCGQSVLPFTTSVWRTEELQGRGMVLIRLCLWVFLRENQNATLQSQSLILMWK